MKSIGDGVYELRDADARSWYRVIYLKKVKNKVNVLHCFEKKTRQTSEKDLATARLRLKRVQERLREERNAAKKS